MLLNCPEAQSRTQTGATLVIVLVVVALVVAIATRMGSDYLLLFSTLEQQQQRDQTRAYLRGAESVAREILLRDIQSGSQTDSLPELWASPRELLLPQGRMIACLDDLQAKLNLNDLADNGDSYSTAQLRFIRLLQVLPLERPLTLSEAQELAHAVFDWVDSDNQPRYPGGAELVEYQQAVPAYRPANQSFASVSELGLVKGMSLEILAALTPHVSVWGNGSLNFNTLDASLSWSAREQTTGLEKREMQNLESAEPLMLRIFGNTNSFLPLSADVAETLAAVRGSAGGALDELQQLRDALPQQQTWDFEGLGFSSDYFQMTAQIHSGGYQYFLQSVLRRSVSPAGVPAISAVARRFGYGSFTGSQGASCVDSLP